MKKENLILLALVGFGIYYFYKNRSTSTATAAPVSPVNPNMPINDTGAGVVKAFSSNDQITAHFSLSGYKKLGNVPNTI